MRSCRWRSHFLKRRRYAIPGSPAPTCTTDRSTPSPMCSTSTGRFPRWRAPGNFVTRHPSCRRFPSMRTTSHRWQPSSTRSTRIINSSSSVDPAPGPALSDRLDAFAMVLGLHQHRLLYNLDIGLLLDRFGESAPDSRAGRDHRQWSVFRYLSRERSRRFAQFVLLDEDIGEAPPQRLLAGDAPPGEEHQVGFLLTDEPRQGVRQSESRVKSDLDEIRSETRLGRRDAKIRHQRES